MKNILSILFIISTITILLADFPFVYKINKGNAKYSNCYQCSKAKTYYVFSLPDTLEKRAEAKKNGCDPIRSVRYCGYKGQIIINKNH